MKKGIISVLSMLVGAALGMTVISDNSKKREASAKKLSDKHEALMMLFNQWLMLKQEGKNVVDYFHSNNIHIIAIYGLSFVGERLKDELKGTDIEIKYAIDKNADNIFSDIDVIMPSEQLPKVDAIIVTPIFFYGEIKRELEKLIQTEIISMEDVLYKLQ